MGRVSPRTPKPPEKDFSNIKDITKHVKVMKDENEPTIVRTRKLLGDENS